MRRGDVAAALPAQDVVLGRHGAVGEVCRKLEHPSEILALRAMAIHRPSFRVEMGANVVLAVDLDYETIQVGSGGGMLMVSASGTAAIIE